MNNSNSKIVNIKHPELGDLEVLVTGLKDMNTMRVYYGSYEITRDLDEDVRLEIIKKVSNANG